MTRQENTKNIQPLDQGKKLVDNTKQRKTNGGNYELTIMLSVALRTHAIFIGFALEV